MLNSHVQPEIALIYGTNKIQLSNMNRYLLDNIYANGSKHFIYEGFKVSSKNQFEKSRNHHGECHHISETIQKESQQCFNNPCRRDFNVTGMKHAHYIFYDVYLHLTNSYVMHSVSEI